MQYGYARVSTVQQDTALQRDAFRRAGVRKVIEEKRSAGLSRPLLEDLLSRLQRGDVLVVYKIDRLARSLVDLLRILARISDSGASFKSLTEPLETQTPVGRMMLQLLGAVAEFERAVIRERCQAGRNAARERGVRFGRPSTVSVDDVRPLVQQGLRQCEVATRLGVSRDVVSRCVRLHGLAIARGKPGRRPMVSLAEIRSLAEKGLLQSEVAQRLGVSRYAVARCARENGVAFAITS
jgi:DNA invertase Pin-like site-specific DNA recombinase